MIQHQAKITTYQKAVAQAVLTLQNGLVIDQLEDPNNALHLALEKSRVAGIMAIKKTWEVLPDRMSVQLDQALITFQFEQNTILIQTDVRANSRSDLQMEAMHGASISALTLMDALRGLDQHIEISGIKTIQQKGHHTQYIDALSQPIKTAVIVCSDSISSGKKEDFSGKAIVAKLLECNVRTEHYEIIPDEINDIQSKVKSLCADAFDLILITGGTGLSDRDVTPEALIPLLEREIPGIAEVIRNYGQQMMPYSMLSRSVAGLIGKTLILALPGSTRGAEESMDALFPYLLHFFKVKQPHGAHKE